jgi:transcriptional regulator with XRE-family HTH domain
MIDLELWNTKRKQLGISLVKLAEMTDISISTIKDIFRGATTDPRIETVQRIEKALGISNEEPEYTEDEKELFELIGQLTDEEAQEMWHFLEYLISKRQKK